MRIEVDLFATLARYLPQGSIGNRATVDIPDGTTVKELLGLLQIPDEVSAVTLVNGQDVAPGQMLRPGDVVAMFPPLAGGQCPGAPDGSSVEIFRSASRRRWPRTA